MLMYVLQYFGVQKMKVICLVSFQHVLKYFRRCWISTCNATTRLAFDMYHFLIPHVRTPKSLRTVAYICIYIYIIFIIICIVCPVWQHAPIDFAAILVNMFLIDLNNVSLQHWRRVRALMFVVGIF
jgi:hypothetical protein